MDSSTKKRLALGFLSSWVGKLSSTIVQLIQVPVFLHFWSVPLYGDWMIVNSIPAYLSFSNIGFGSVAGNEMSILVATEDRDGALGVFQSCWWLISIICVGMIVVLGVGLAFVPPAKLLRLSAHQRDGYALDHLFILECRFCLDSWSLCCRQLTVASAATPTGRSSKAHCRSCAFALHDDPL